MVKNDKDFAAKKAIAKAAEDMATGVIKRRKNKKRSGREESNKNEEK